MKYRIVRDRYRGYEVQVKRWFLPWHQPTTNTHSTEEEAINWANEHANTRDYVKYLGELP